VFREFEEESFAAASLGQVHRAVTRDGEKVAVKIQYPAIRAAIENDFKLLRSAMLPGQVTGHVPAALIDEIQRGILEETDYMREADNLEFFARGLRHLDYVSIPRVHRELSTDRVLTMSFIEGGSLADLLKQKPSREFRQTLTERICEMFETQLHHLKAIHADQHPGNYLFRPDGHIGLIDFGCIKKISLDIQKLRESHRDRVWRWSEAAKRDFLRMVFGPGIPYARSRKILPIVEKWCDVFYPEDRNADIVVDFAKDPKLEAKFREVQREMINRTLRDKLINPEYAFITRADIGLRYLLREIGAKVNYSEIVRRVSGYSL
jgi:serine/threonine protein kinase